MNVTIIALETHEYGCSKLCQIHGTHCGIQPSVGLIFLGDKWLWQCPEAKLNKSSHSCGRKETFSYWAPDGNVSQYHTEANVQLLCLPQASLPWEAIYPPEYLWCENLFFYFWNRPLRCCSQEVRAIFLFFFFILALLIIFMRLFTDYKSLLRNEICGCLIYSVHYPTSYHRWGEISSMLSGIILSRTSILSSTHNFFHVPTLGKAAWHYNLTPKFSGQKVLSVTSWFYFFILVRTFVHLLFMGTCSAFKTPLWQFPQRLTMYLT